MRPPAVKSSDRANLLALRDTLPELYVNGFVRGVALGVTVIAEHHGVVAIPLIVADIDDLATDDSQGG
jgi:hypothetical protein